MDASPEALDYLRANPHLWRQFRDKYGSVPTDFVPPRAPAEAEDHLFSHPDLASDFIEKYGYLAKPQDSDPRAWEMAGGKGGGVRTKRFDHIEDAYNLGKLTKRSGARLVEGLTELPSAAAYTAGALPFAAKGTAGVPEAGFGEGVADARPAADEGMFGGLNTMGLEIKLGRKPTPEDVKTAQAEWDATHGKNAPQKPATLAERSGSAVRDFASPITESAPITGTRKWAKEKEQDAVNALTPNARRALELSLVEHDEENGGLRVGEGASDPWWWAANVIDVGVQAAPGFGVTGIASRMSYAAKYRQVLAELALKKVPQSVALRVAGREAMKAAKRGAVIAGGLTEGGIAGGQDAAQVRETIESVDEETLMAYPGYVELRDQGLSHEQARDRIAGDKAAAVALSSGAVVGITGAPMNAYFGKLTARLGRTAKPTAIAERLATAGKGALGEGAQEFVQEGAEQTIQNKAEQPITGKATWDGVLENAITGFVLGGTVGGALDLAVSGKKAKTPKTEAPITDTPSPMGPVQAAETKYEAANKALEQGLAAARDPNVKIKYDAIQKLREDRKTAMVDLTRELLHSGAFKDEQQTKVAEALRQAETEGVAATPRKPAGGDVSPQRDVALEAAANAGQLEESDANDLISNGLAKVNPRGVVVLTPEGRRQRKAAQERAEAESAESGDKKPADAKVAPKPATKKVITRPKMVLPPEKRAAREAKNRTAFLKKTRARTAETSAQATRDADALKATVQAKAGEQAQTADELAAQDISTPNPQMRDAFERARRGPSTKNRARVAFRIKDKAVPRGFRDSKVTDFRAVQQTAMVKMSAQDRSQVDLLPEDFKGRVVLSEDGAAGFGVSENGELVSLFKTPGAKVPNLSQRALRAAKAMGATHLHAFDTYLTKAYAKRGAKETGRVKFDPKYAPKEWDTKTMGAPDLVRMDLSEVPDAETLKFKHFSKATEDQIDLDPEKMGTGAKGAEAKRNGPKVTSLYAEHGETEPDISNGRTRYNVEIPKEDLYDGSSDPQGLLRQAQVPYGLTQDSGGNMVPVGQRFDMNKFEELVRDAGYLGYHTPDASGILKGQARIFQKYPATREGAGKVAIAARMKRKTSEETVRGLLTPEENARLKKASAKKLIEVFDELPEGAELAAAAVAGQAKRGWYRRSSEALVNVFGPDAPRFAALLAALSPQTSVEWNFRNATSVWVGWDKAGRPTDRKTITSLMRDHLFRGSSRVGRANVLPAWVNNTVRALTAEDPSTVTLSGPKVDSFAANLRGETERVTLDAWMANWAGVNQTLFKGELTADPTNPGLRPGYLAFSARVREAAEILSKRTGETWTASEVQETVWSWAKALYEHAESFGDLATAREILDNKELTDDLINATPDFAGLFADPEISAALSGTVYGERAARSAGEAPDRRSTGRKAAPAAEDARYLRKAADRLDALRDSRKEAEAETRESGAARVAAPAQRGLPLGELQAVTARLQKELGISAKIADTQADLPDYIQDMIPEGSVVTGMFVEDEIEGTTEMWQVRENLDSTEEAYANAIHEAVGHMGLRAVLGKSYHRVMEDIRKSFPEKVAWAAKQNAIDMNHPDPATRRRLQSLAAEELIAYAAERVLGNRGALSKQSVWRRIIAKIRDILRGVGLLNSYSGEDLEALIYRARDFFRKPARTRAQEIDYRSKVAAAVKQQPDDAPQWLSPEEYAALDAREAQGSVNPEQIKFSVDFDAILAGESDFNGQAEVNALADGRNIGYVLVDEKDVTDTAWTAMHVYVDPKYRGKGVAQRMYAAISARLGKQPAPANIRTPHGRSMWDSFKRRAVDFSDAPVEGELPSPSEKEVAFAFKQGPTGNQDLDSFISKIGVRPKTLRQRWNEFRHDAKEKAAMGLFDELHGIKAAEEIAGVAEKDQGYVSARLSRAAPEVVASIIEHGPPVWNDGAPDVGQGMGLLPILAPLKGNVNLWLTYVSALRAARLKTEGRENLFTPAEIAAATALGQQHPEFDVARQQYNKLQKQVLDFAQEAGVIDPQTRAMWEHSDYIPFHRIMQGGEVTISSKAGGGIGFIRNQIKQLKGGRQNIGDPLENIVRNWQALMDASLQAVAGRMTIDNLNGSGLVTPHKGVVNAAPIQSLAALTKANPNLATALTNAGINIQTMPPQALAGLQKMIGIAPPAGKDVVSVWRNGKKEFWHVHDPNLFRSLKNINPKLWGPWMKLFSFPKRIVTKTITMTPQFMVKNFWRDMWHSFVTGAQSDKTRINMLPTDSLAGLAIALANTPDYRSMVAGGGGFGESFVESGDPASMAGSVRRSINKGKTRGILLNTPVKIWRFYRMLQNAAENANRVAVYKKAMNAGLDRRAALYQSRDLMDFSMRGNFEIIRLIVGMTPFFNARLQGLYRLARGGKQSFVSVALRGLLISAASLALLAANHDDERYKALTDQEKSTYWHFFVGDAHYRLPKPFEVGTIFGTIPEAIGDAMITNADEPDAVRQAAKLVGYSFGETLNLAPQPATVWPLVELAINQDTFTGSPILTQGDEAVLPEDQRGPGTSPTYAALAGMMPSDGPEALRSPKQLEHLGRGYIGNIQDYVLTVTDSLVRKANGEPAAPEKAIQDIPGLRDFYRTGPARNTRHIIEMYKLADEAAKVTASIHKAEKADSDEGDARVEELEQKYPQLLDVADDFKKAAAQVTDLKKEQRKIQLDDAMSPADKRAEIDDIQTEINEIAKDVYDLRPGGKLNPETAGELIAVPPSARARILRNNNMPATADLLESLG